MNWKRPCYSDTSSWLTDFLILTDSPTLICSLFIYLIYPPFDLNFLTLLLLLLWSRSSVFGLFGNHVNLKKSERRKQNCDENICCCCGCCFGHVWKNKSFSFSFINPKLVNLVLSNNMLSATRGSSCCCVSTVWESLVFFVWQWLLRALTKYSCMKFCPNSTEVSICELQRHTTFHLCQVYFTSTLQYK